MHGIYDIQDSRSNKTKGAVGKKVIGYRIKVLLVPQCHLVEQQRKGKMFVMCV